MARHANERLANQPELAARAGVPLAPRTLPEIDPQAVALRWQAARTTLAAAEALSPAALPPASRAALTNFMGERREELAGAVFPEELVPLSGANGGYAVWVTTALARGEVVPESAAAHEAWLQALGFVPLWVDAALANLAEAEARGITFSPGAWRALAARVAAAIPQDLRPPAGAWGAVDGPVRQQLAERYVAVAENQVRPALQRLHQRLLLAASRSAEGRTWRDLPLGERWYAWRLQQATDATRSAAEWQSLAQAELARIELMLAGQPAPAGAPERLPPAVLPAWRLLVPHPAHEAGYTCYRWMSAASSNSTAVPAAAATPPVPAGLDQVRQLLAMVVVDTGQNALGWNRAEAIDYLRAHTRWSAGEAARQADLAVATAGWTLAPGVGCLQLWQLRQEVAARLGAAFDAAAFDHQLAAWGPLPLGELRRRMLEWVAVHDVATGAGGTNLATASAGNSGRN